MKKTQASKNRESSDEMRREYRFDYSKAKPDRFATPASEQRMVIVPDPDIPKF